MDSYYQAFSISTFGRLALTETNRIRTNNSEKNFFQKILACFSILVLVATLVFPLFVLPAVNGHTPPQDIVTFAYVYAKPNLIGVNQVVTIEFGLDPAPPTANATGGDRWMGLTVTITRPDGTTETKGPYASNATGQGYFLYTPTMTGTYNFRFSFPGQVIRQNNPTTGSPGVYSEYVNDTFLSSVAQSILMVQQAPVQLTSPSPPSASPQPSTVQTTASVILQRNLIGVGQTMLVILSITPAPPTYNEPFNGLMLIVTLPDGVVNTLGPFTSNSTGFGFVSYTPAMVGTYYLQLNYAGQFFTGSKITYLSSTSSRAELRVQQQPVSTETSPTQTATSIPTYTPSSSPTIAPTYIPSPKPTETQPSTETATPYITEAPFSTVTDSPTPTLRIVLQKDEPSPPLLFLSPITIGTLMVVMVIVVIVVYMLSRLYRNAKDKK